MKHKLISVGLVTVLLFMALGAGLACGPVTPPTQYDLTITSTDGGDVTTPTEGTHTYDEGTIVDLTATPDADYRFVNWTGDVDDIADVNDATTTITMNDDYAITANFAFDMAFIEDVPDANQPPPGTLLTTTNPTNYCAPMAMVNVLGYWDAAKGLPNAKNLTAFQLPPNLGTVAEYLGWFMDTNNNPMPPGNPDRGNGPHFGTFAKDIALGTVDFVRWDAGHPPLTPPVFPPPWPLPPGKLGYDWTVTDDYAAGFPFYQAEIDAGRPLVVCFKYWNPQDPIPGGLNVTDPQTGATISVKKWGDPESGSHDPNPYEDWNLTEGELCIGHAVTGVGYILNWAVGGQPAQNYVIVHDNWSTTPENIAIPWTKIGLAWSVWNSSHAVTPS